MNMNTPLTIGMLRAICHAGATDMVREAQMTTMLAGIRDATIIVGVLTAIVVGIDAVIEQTREEQKPPTP